MTTRDHHWALWTADAGSQDAALSPPSDRGVASGTKEPIECPPEDDVIGVTSEAKCTNLAAPCGPVSSRDRAQYQSTR